MSVFNFKSYRSFLKEFIQKQPRRGHGQISKIAQAVGIQTTLMSMILSGRRDPSSEQSYEISEYLELTSLEQEYFLLLVQLERAGTQRLKSHLQKKLTAVKTEAQKIDNRFAFEKRLSDHDQALFYSSWIYSAIRLFCTTDESGKTMDEICSRFHIPRNQAFEILKFLRSTGVVIEEGDHFKMGVGRTFLEKGSVHVSRHHLNWRMKAMQRLEQMEDDELMFTSPISISTEDFKKLREQIADFIQNFSNLVKESPAEEVACLNIDLFYAIPRDVRRQ